MNHGTYEVLVGDSAAIRQLRVLIAQVGPTPHRVLIHGPSGSGKELVARALHHAGNRSGPLVSVNVCAIPDTMFESTIFGHVRGAFTGASTDSAGFLREADRGTAFLDEISGLPPVSQAKLLRAIETRCFRPVGARSDQRSDFRLIAATNEHLGSLANTGRFRADLLHRLGTIVLNVPALRDRIEDIAILARHFVAQLRRVDQSPSELSQSALSALETYDWPGNVRQLRNVIDCASIISRSPRIDGPDVEHVLRTQKWLVDTANAASSGLSGEAAQDGVNDLRAMRQRYIALLETHSWKVEETASAIGIHRATLSKRLRMLGINSVSHRRFAEATLPIKPCAIEQTAP